MARGMDVNLRNSKVSLTVSHKSEVHRNEVSRDFIG